MMVQPLVDAIEAAKSDLGQDTPVIYLSPQGKSWIIKECSCSLVMIE